MFSKTLGHSGQELDQAASFATRTFGGLALILAHELNAMSGHWAEARERIAVARQARSLGELVRYQIDLVPETRARLSVDRRERRELAGRWLAELSSAFSVKA